jgi:spore germination protein GerM
MDINGINKRFASVSLLIALALILNACGSSGRQETAEPAGTQGQAEALEDTLVQIYFHNSRLDSSQSCDKVFPVTRQIEPDRNRAQAALEQLFQGPTQSEQAQGYSSFFSQQTAGILKGFKVVGATAYINLSDIRAIIPNASTSCGSQGFLAEVETTLKDNLPELERTIFAINGDPRTFYDWMQIGCGEFNDNCNPQPFQSIN